MERFIQKRWGTVFRGESNAGYCIEHLRINPRTCCSIHQHRGRSNTFIIVSGELAVLSWRPVFAEWPEGLDVPEADFLRQAWAKAFIRQIHAGEPPLPVTIESGRWHQFANMTDEIVTCTEIYLSDGCNADDRDDIYRLTVGGEIPDELLNLFSK